MITWYSYNYIVKNAVKDDIRAGVISNYGGFDTVKKYPHFSIVTMTVSPDDIKEDLPMVSFNGRRLVPAVRVENLDREQDVLAGMANEDNKIIFDELPDMILIKNNIRAMTEPETTGAECDAAPYVIPADKADRMIDDLRANGYAADVVKTNDLYMLIRTDCLPALFKWVVNEYIPGAGYGGVSRIRIKTGVSENTNSIDRQVEDFYREMDSRFIEVSNILAADIRQS